MKHIVSLALLLVVPCSALAQDFHKGGFFDSDVSQKGFFTEDQAGIPVKNNTGLTTTRSNKDSWEVSPERLAVMQNAQNDSGAQVVNAEQVVNGVKEQTSPADSFEVKKAPTD